MSIYFSKIFTALVLETFEKKKFRKIFSRMIINISRVTYIFFINTNVSIMQMSFCINFLEFLKMAFIHDKQRYVCNVYNTSPGNHTSISYIVCTTLHLLYFYVYLSNLNHKYLCTVRIKINIYRNN